MSRRRGVILPTPGRQKLANGGLFYCAQRSVDREFLPRKRRWQFPLIARRFVQAGTLGGSRRLPLQWACFDVAKSAARSPCRCNSASGTGRAVAMNQQTASVGSQARKLIAAALVLGICRVVSQWNSLVAGVAALAVIGVLAVDIVARMPRLRRVLLMAARPASVLANALIFALGTFVLL